jgi:hypothetical protein
MNHGGRHWVFPEGPKNAWTMLSAGCISQPSPYIPSFFAPAATIPKTIRTTATINGNANNTYPLCNFGLLCGQWILISVLGMKPFTFHHGPFEPALQLVQTMHTFGTPEVQVQLDVRIQKKWLKLHEGQYNPLKRISSNLVIVRTYNTNNCWRMQSPS